MPVTVLICAICEVICALSIGAVGSWFFNWATSSVRNWFCISAALVAPKPFCPLAALAFAAVLEIGVNIAVCLLVFLSAYWPSCKVLSNSVFAVFMTSTLFW